MSHNALPGSLRNDFTYLATANIVNALCLWGILISIVRLGNSEMLGIYALGMAVSAPIIMFFNLQLRALLATDSLRKFNFIDYFSLRFSAVCTAIVVIALVAFLLGFRGDKFGVTLALGAAKSAEAMSDIVYGLLQQRGAVGRLAISRILHGVLGLVSMTVALLLTGSIVTACVSVAIGWIILFFVLDLPAARRVLTEACDNSPVIQFNAQPVLQLVRLAYPLGFVMLLISLNANIPKYFIEGFLGEASLGTFAALAYLIVAANQVMIALWQAASPRLSRYYTSLDFKGFWRLFSGLSSLAILFGVLGWLFVAVVGGPVLEMLYGAEFRSLIQPLKILMVAGGAMYLSSLCGHSLTAVRKIDVQMPLSLVFVLISIFACWMLVPKYGLVGASLAVLLATSLQIPPKLWVLFRTVRGAQS